MKTAWMHTQTAVEINKIHTWVENEKEENFNATHRIVTS